MSKAIRLDYLDLMKGFGIFFVVWAHTMCPIHDWIYSFHMPLFFLISGLFFSNKTDFNTFAIKKAKQLLIPFVTFNLFGVLAHVLIYMHKNDGSLTNFSFRDEVGLGYLKGELYFPNSITWFLWSLFFISILVFLLSRILKSSKWLWLSVSVTLYFLSIFFVNRGYILPYFINSILYGQLYFTLAYLGKEWILKAVQTKHYLRIVVVTLAYIASYWYCPTTTTLMQGLIMGNPAVHLIQCLTVLYLIAVVCYHIKQLPFFTFWGINSLYMLGLNFPLLCVIDYFYFSFVPKNYYSAFGGIILIFGLAYPIYFFLNKYLPIALGKSKK